MLIKHKAKLCALLASRQHAKCFILCIELQTCFQRYMLNIGHFPSDPPMQNPLNTHHVQITMQVAVYCE